MDIQSQTISTLDELVVEVNISVVRVGCSPIVFGYNTAELIFI